MSTEQHGNQNEPPSDWRHDPLPDWHEDGEIQERIGRLIARAAEARATSPFETASPCEASSG